jgi:glutamate--cysteine ligase
MRGADAGQWHRLCALPAFWVGICYDQSSLDAAWDIVKNWDEDDRENLRVAAAKDGLNGSVGNLRLIDLGQRSCTNLRNWIKKEIQSQR